ncbi:hypothetical protein DVH24_018779 [Malus domestica]|uniref:Uncharacterized protein n=1 Tax=Malus domestica TaxID=3750 RepID=A0A498HMB6_MALDO|nr:hypothetical protein DVH24_018779 [Malus domestica]
MDCLTPYNSILVSNCSATPRLAMQKKPKRLGNNSMLHSGKLESAYQSNYKEFDLDLDPQDDGNLEFKADEDVVHITLDPDKLKCKTRIRPSLSD